MYMDKREISYEYKTAKHKTKQIHILAELNSVHPFQICEVLLNRGELEADEHNYAGYFVIMKLLNDGMSVSDIAELFGITQKKIKTVYEKYKSAMDYISSEPANIEYLKDKFKKRSKSKTARLEEELDKAYAKIHELEMEIKRFKETQYV